MSKDGMKFGWIWVFLVVVLLQARQLDACLEEERLGLLQIKAYMNSVINTTKSYINLTWPDNGDRGNCCAWERVQCSSSTGRVTKLNLSSIITMRYESYDDDFNVLPLDPDPWVLNVTLFNPFKQLIGLNLSFTSCSGLVEADGSTNISTLKNLQSLSLHGGYLRAANISFSALTSVKQMDIGNCGLDDSNLEALGLEKKKDLQLLDLTNNRFQRSGELFAKFANLTELQVLDLSNNRHLQGLVKGVCNLRNLRELYLSKNGLSGSLPSCLFNLTSLQVLDVSDNHLSGEIPKMLPNLTSLQYLDLSINNIKGKLSLSCLANLSKLQVLRIGGNELQVRTEDSSWQPTFQLRELDLLNCSLNKPNGTIPKFFKNQYHLSFLRLSRNSLVGVFPTWLLNNNPLLRELHLYGNALTGCFHLPPDANFSLTHLIIAYNNFQGKLPENFGLAFPQLKVLAMSGNHFEGNIPASTAHMGHLEVLALQGNNFSGELPRRLLSDCQALRDLYLSDNNLHGDIIPEHMNLPNLNLLSLRNNSFGGTITEAGLKNSTNLSLLDISNNKVTGRVPSLIGRFSKMYALSMSNNTLEGEIPTEICNLYNLNFLDLSKNKLTGHIPSCNNFSMLYILHLHNNSLTGTIPNILWSTKSIRILNLRDNQLLGGIPPGIDKLSSVRLLLLAGNNLDGPIPNEMCGLSNISLLDLSRNRLHGRIPKCFGNMPFWNGYNQQKALGGAPDLYSGITLFPSGKDFIVILVKNVYYSYKGTDLNLMSGLDLSSNKITGIIPSELGDMSQIHAVNLSHNCLSGIIPSSFANLKQVESLDLSYNNLSGIIPSQLVELNSLEIFNVSYNNLSGRIPETGQFGTFDEYNYLGNSGLCGSRLNKSCHPSNALSSPTSTSSTKEGANDAALLDMEDFLWSFGMSSVIAFLTIIVVLLINPQWREAWFNFVEWHILWWLPLPQL